MLVGARRSPLSPPLLRGEVPSVLPVLPPRRDRRACRHLRRPPAAAYQLALPDRAATHRRRAAAASRREAARPALSQSAAYLHAAGRDAPPTGRGPDRLAVAVGRHARDQADERRRSTLAGRQVHRNLAARRRHRPQAGREAQLSGAGAVDPREARPPAAAPAVLARHQSGEREGGPRLHHRRAAGSMRPARGGAAPLRRALARRPAAALRWHDSAQASRGDLHSALPPAAGPARYADRGAQADV
mmetsp:Transcript_42731/g.139048  ORF Transcript_42731/g.139048 Transcript_42731/m.139048 type:complete len:245 (-) Transcript_42731:240-974(-)